MRSHVRLVSWRILTGERQSRLPYYAFVSLAPTPADTVAESEFPALNDPAAVPPVSCVSWIYRHHTPLARVQKLSHSFMSRGLPGSPTKLSSSLPPAHRKSWYVERSDIDGASPESFHATAIVPPAVKVAPAAGVVNSTSAKAKGAEAAKSSRQLRSMVGANLVQASVTEAIQFGNDSSPHSPVIRRGRNVEMMFVGAICRGRRDSRSENMTAAAACSCIGWRMRHASQGSTSNSKFTQISSHFRSIQQQNLVGIISSDFNIRLRLCALIYYFN